MGRHSEASTSSVPAPLAVSNSRLSLRLAAPQQGSFVAGQTIHPTLEVKPGTDYTDLSLRLIGSTSSMIMGRERWQAGVMLNASMGSPAMVIQTPETAEFFSVEIPFPSSQAQDTKEKGSSHAHFDASGVYEVTLPDMTTEGALLPTYKCSSNDSSGAGVKYALQIVGKRKGLLKTTDRLTLEIPVSCPLNPPIPQSISQEQWPFAVTTRPLKYASNDGQGLSVEARLMYHPLSRRSDPLRFTLILTPSSPTAVPLIASADPSSPSPKIHALLSRRVITTPVKDAGIGQSDYPWPALRIAPAKVDSTVSPNDGRWVWNGEIEVPKGECSVESKGVRIRFNIGVQLSSPAFAQLLKLNLPIFLPSSNHVLPDPPQWNGGGAVAHAEEEEEEEQPQLPSYSA